MTEKQLVGSGLLTATAMWLVMDATSVLNLILGVFFTVQWVWVAVKWLRK